MHAPKSKQKRRRYSVEEKMEVLKFARTNSVKLASARFGINKSCIHLWRGSEDDFEQAIASSKRSPNNNRPASAPRARANAIPSLVEPTCESKEPTPRTPTRPRTSRCSATPNGASADVVGVDAVPDVASLTSEDLTTTVTTPPHGNDNEMRAARFVFEDRAPPTQPFRMVGFLGERDGFAEVAALRTLRELVGGNVASGQDYALTGYPNPVRMLEAVHRREIDYAFVPIDTLLSITNHAPLDRAISLSLSILGEVAFEESVSVCAFPGTRLNDADCVMSDLPLLSRYEEYILELEDQFNTTIHRQVAWDSATACRLIREEESPNTLVLCREEAARAHGLDVLLQQIETTCRTTKYAIVGPRGAAALQLNTERVGASKRQCTLMLSTAGRADLSDVTSAFAHLNLSIEFFSIRSHGDEPTRYGMSHY
jgi:prephenate dehydratase